MTKRTRIILGSLVVVWLLMALAVCAVLLRGYDLWPPSSGSAHRDVYVLQTKKSPSGRWTAVVQLEVDGGSLAADYGLYVVRLKGPTQKNSQGDVVMFAEVAYPVPRPFVSWKGDKLIVTLLHHEKYQYFTSPVDGVVVDIQRK